MENKNGGDKPQVSGVETAAGFTAGVVSTLIFHPLDVIKTRLQVNLQTATGPTKPKPRPLSTMDVVRSFTKAKNPVLAAYRGLPVNLVANSASWAFFFQFKETFEDAIADMGYPLMSGDKPSGLGYFVTSGLAGVTTSCITNPLWLLRTRITSTDRHTAEAYPNMRAGALRVYRGEGLKGFYKGLGTSLIGTSHGAIQFALYEPLRNAYFTWKGDKEKQKMSTEATLAISTAAKTTATVVTFPHQVVRNRLQNQRGTDVYGAGISGVVRKMWQEGGVRPFYRGIVPGLLRTLPSTWVTFMVIEYVRFHLPRWLDETDGGGVSGE
ncbi:hypothetical protein INS49_015547 [Diaporthe citri]|uniref:uncharacterized protein n=1 Tax=Diaporthe citri TaxID=83186 RepID=UPI001C815650|nr:uncharacterized protein INS49_015547 [Diaporthe citri]KAG6356160.1 hypothetical protein INS49_015547 [Diaporthe citri]